MCPLNSSHRVKAFPSGSLSLRLFLWNLQSDIGRPKRAIVKKEISSVKNWKKAF
ncbi:nef attachable domain protein [Chlamydia psittaci C1/97]|nr:nef attachable domain protein [Chlamydia psittaci C1/97]